MEKKPKRIGNYINEKAGTGFAGNVWDKDYLMPTITTCGGGSRQPAIIRKYPNKVKVIGKMDNSTDHTFDCINRVYDKEACSPTISTCIGSEHQPKFIRKWIRE